MSGGLRHHAESFTVPTEGRGTSDITRAVQEIVRRADVRGGQATVFVHHTSASIIVCENADPTVRRDLEAFFERLAPEQPGLYLHDAEGPDDMPAHIRTALTQTQLSIPLVESRLALGTWQGLYLFEHRWRPHRRQIALHLLGA